MASRRERLFFAEPPRSALPSSIVSAPGPIHPFLLTTPLLTQLVVALGFFVGTIRVSRLSSPPQTPGAERSFYLGKAPKPMHCSAPQGLIPMGSPQDFGVWLGLQIRESLSLGSLACRIPCGMSTSSQLELEPVSAKSKRPSSAWVRGGLCISFRVREQ